MKRAYQIEMTVMHQYARQRLALGVFVAACTCVGMRSIVAAPGVLTCMYFIMGALATSAYDEQNGWGLFRLTMPLSRRDVVIGRYGMITTIGLIGMVAGLVGGTALAAIATVAPLPGDLSTTFGLTQDNIQAMVFSCALCAVIGSGIAAIETPVYLRFGQTKATQWIPMISVILFIAPMMILGATGGLGNFAGIADALSAVFAFIETPLGAITSLAVSLVAVFLILGVSAAISIRLYERREL
ncbi:ABC-2 transporter permease [Collinsella tanakaei]|nr:ABC-2 transporter permease [Collinsella tanakaei]